MLEVAQSDYSAIRLAVENSYGVVPSAATTNITGATNAAPIVIQAPGHGKQTGAYVTVAGVTGNTNANGDWDIVRIDNDNFALVGSQGNAAYISGGTVRNAAIDVPLNSESLKPSVEKKRSARVGSGGQARGLVVMGRSAAGSIMNELSYKAFDLLIAALMRSQWEVYGHRGVGSAFTGTFSGGNVLTAGAAPTGASAFINLKRGDWVQVRSSSIAANNKWAQLSKTVAPTSTVLTFEGSPFTNGAGGAACAISSSRIKNGDLKRSLSVEKYFSDTGWYHLLTGLQVDSGKVDTKVGDFVMLDVTLNGKKGAPMQNTASALPAFTAQPTAYDSFSSTDGISDVQEGGAVLTDTTFTALSLTVNNNGAPRRGLGVDSATGMRVGQFMYSVGGETYFVNATLYNKYDTNAKSSMSFAISDAAGNGYVILMPCLRYSGDAPSASGINTDVMMPLNAESETDSANFYGAEPWGKTLLIYRLGDAV